MREKPAGREAGNVSEIWFKPEEWAAPGTRNESGELRRARLERKGEDLRMTVGVTYGDGSRGIGGVAGRGRGAGNERRRVCACVCVCVCARAQRCAHIKLQLIKLTKATAPRVPRGHRAGAANDARGEGEGPMERWAEPDPSKNKAVSLKQK